MKKIASIFIAIALFICGLFSLNGCGLIDFSSEAEAATKDLERLIDCLDKRDRNGVKALFSAKQIAGVENFDEGLDELFSLYSGNFVSHNFDIPATYEDIDYGKIKKWFIIAADITTTEDVFRTIMYWCDQNDTDKDSIGIWSLYMFNKKDNPLDDYSFYGDKGWTDEDVRGIYVVKPYKYAEMTLNIFSGKDGGNVEQLFAPSVIERASSFDESVQRLFAYYGDKHTACVEKASDVSVLTGADGKVSRRYRMYSYAVETADGTYLLALKYCDRDVEASGNVGMHSVYIKKAEPDDSPYWGDGLWTEGINIDDAQQ